MTRACTTAALALLFTVLSAPILAPARAQADETIRVAIFQNVESVTVASSAGLLLQAPNDTVDSNGQSTVGAGASGLIVDGQRLRSDRLDVRGRDGELTVNGLTVGGRVIVKRQNGKLLAINELPLEDYVKGVVPSEMSTAWHPEALKAQAIADGTYGWSQIRRTGNKAFDVAATVKDQVYESRGRATASGQAARAVDETRDLVLAYRDEPIFAAYFSTSAGQTEDALNVWGFDLPYLKGVECPFDLNSPWYQWRTDVGLPTLEQRLREEGFRVGVIASLAPAFPSRTGRVTSVRILHSDGVLYVRGDELRRVLMLASTKFDLDIVGMHVQFSRRPGATSPPGSSFRRAGGATSGRAGARWRCCWYGRANKGPAGTPSCAALCGPASRWSCRTASSRA